MKKNNRKKTVCLEHLLETSELLNLRTILEPFAEITETYKRETLLGTVREVRQPLNLEPLKAIKDASVVTSNGRYRSYERKIRRTQLLFEVFSQESSFSIERLKFRRTSAREPLRNSI